LWRFLSKKWDSFINLYWAKVEAACESDENCHFMRQALHEVAQEYEQMPYETLLQPAEVLSMSRIFGKMRLDFSAEAYDVDKDGDIHFCIDVDGLPTKTKWKPSYRFVKRRDGSVRHG